MLHAQVTNLAVMRSRMVGDHAHARFVAGGGLAGIVSRVNRRVNALFHARLAYGHDRQGKRGIPSRSWAAREVLARVDAGTPTPA